VEAAAEREFGDVAQHRERDRARRSLLSGRRTAGFVGPPSELISAFAAAAPFKIIKGFAVGRTIFEAPARDWFRGDVGDEAAVQQMAANLAMLVSAWRHTRAEAMA
jgi:myo-inositol catabolism protein IolC